MTLYRQALSVLPLPRLLRYQTGLAVPAEESVPTAAPATVPVERARVPAWEGWAVFLVTLAVLAAFTPRMAQYLDPVSGDEPFYLMTAISIIEDRDINECNNYIAQDEARFYPSFYSFDGQQAWAAFPEDWRGWRGAPYPLPPHPAMISPASRQCASIYRAYPVNYDNPDGELYSKHGLGMSLLVLPAYAIGDRLGVIFFLNAMGALLAAMVYLLARESTGRVLPGVLTWAAFAFTVPFMPYSYLIFPELPAAVFVIYAFRRIRLMDNNFLQTSLVGYSIAFLPWLHYRFAPICLGLALYYIVQDRRHREPRRAARYTALLLPPVVSAGLLAAFFMHRYGMPFPNPADHAGINDVAGTLRGLVGLFLDQQWGLFVASPVFILALVGLLLMGTRSEARRDLLWLGLIGLPYVLVVANYAQWWGEWCPPARYLTSVLPLAALPFAYALSNIKSAAYLGVYGALLLLSLLTMWGFIVQPQWMFNQPTGKANLFVNGLPVLLDWLDVAWLRDLNLAGFFPSFVTPYFGYLKSDELGDALSQAAWRGSIWPAALIALIVLACLGIAWFSGRRTRPGATGGAAEGPGGDDRPDAELLPAAPSIGATVEARLRPIATGIHSFLSALVPQRPAFAFAGASPFGIRRMTPLRFQAGTPGTTEDTAGEIAPTPSGSNGHEPEEAAPAPVAPCAPTGTAAGDGATPTPQRSLWSRLRDNFVVRTRGFWLGAIGVALAINAQRILTVERDVVTSIRWYFIAILVVIVAWAGTYRNKSTLAEPLPRRERRPGRNTPEPAELPAEATPEPANALAPPVHAELPVRRRSVSAADGAGEAAAAGTGSVRSRSGQITAPAEPEAPPYVPEPVPAEPVQPLRPAPAPSARERVALVRARWTQAMDRFPFLGGPWPRYVVAFAGLGLNLYCANLIRQDYFSAVGGWGWVLSLLIIAGAFLREPKQERTSQDADAVDIEDRTDLRLPRWAEIALVAGIVVVALVFRLYRLDDLTGGMHGDEGEFGMNALAILSGDRISPFMTGWFAHPNFSFYSQAATMAVAGWNLFGLRLFAALMGTLMVLPFYGLVRMWFGVRAALIASVLLAVMGASVYFGRVGLNNIATPFFLVTGLYFLMRGLRDLRTLNFALSGFSFTLGLYYYFAGRLSPFILAAVVAYVLVFLPLARLPGKASELRRLSPGMTRGAAWRGAAMYQLRTAWQYGGKFVILAVAAVAMATPWIVYYVDHKFDMDSRTQDKSIFSPVNEGRMASQHNATHDPLYLGLKAPDPAAIYPWLPFAFEKTPMSVQLAEDGYWPRAIWGQTTTTLSIFTYRHDLSSFYTFTFEPAAKPLEAAFLIIGLAWAFWRWKDARFGTLNLWFWMTILAGGALTIDAPYLPRLAGLIPAVAILIAVPLNKLAAEFMGLLGGLRETDRAPRLRRGLGYAATGVSIAAFLAYLGWINFNDYFNRYMASWPYPEVVGQAYFVQQMNKRVTSEGRPVPHYYDIGIHLIYWGHGDNRFVNFRTPGEDMTNPSNELPITDNGDRDVVFMVWELNRHYLPVLQAYYPGGEVEPFVYGPEGRGPQIFTSYRVKKEQIDARRVSTAVYTPEQGPAIERQEEGIGTNAPPPGGLAYPVRASWTGQIVAPAYGRYKFSLENQGDALIVLDGQEVAVTSPGAPRAEVELLLARGVHDIYVEGALQSEADQVAVQWQVGGSAFEPIARQFIWQGPGRALLGQIGSPISDLLAPEAGNMTSSLLHARMDGFVGYRHSPEALVMGSMQGRWTGTLSITEPGNYSFEVTSNG
ncbi:MAG TPA: glycosyltransferase family 39 protein, partial [Chloroflexia bacterium]|nr:glycosyltransferase family 39 protein [Chloroflexia bacterium]